MLLLLFVICLLAIPFTNSKSFELTPTEEKALLKELQAEFDYDEDQGQGQPIDVGAVRKNRHERFFDKLTEIEQEWVLRLAIAHEGDDQQHSVESQWSKPTPSDFYQLIPESVMEMMLNGEISNTFQKKLVNWLKKDLGYTDEDFKQFELKSPEFCQGTSSDSQSNCMSLLNIGGLCCPFG